MNKDRDDAAPQKSLKIDFKALETITKKVLAHKPKKQVSGESKNDNK